MRGSVSFSLLLLGFVLAAGCGDGGTSGTGGSGTGGTGTGGSGGTGGATATAAPLQVDTDKGAVQGTLSGTTRAFLGVPFAAPPTGDLRWKPPAPHAPWADTLDASTKGRACTQMASFSSKVDAKSGEDCLTLNVWTPSSPASDKLPVMVWIHGGGFAVGSGAESRLDGAKLAADGLPTLLVCSASSEESALVSLSDVVVHGPEGVLDLLRRLTADIRAAG